MGTFSILVVVVIAVSVTGIHGKPCIYAAYDGTYTLRVDYKKRVESGEYIEDSWDWKKVSTITTSSKVVKRDAEKERFQEVQSNGDATIVQKDSDGKFQTYLITKSDGVCKIKPGGWEATKDALSFPSVAAQKRSRTKTENGKKITMFQEAEYDLNGDYVDTWVTVIDRATDSHLPVSHEIYRKPPSEEEWEDSSTTTNTYTSVEQDWMDVPDNCEA